MREYRQNAHAGSLLVWAALCAVTAGILYLHSGRVLPGRPLRTGERAGAAALFVLGPLAVTVYLLRARYVWVAVDPTRGILVGGRRLIAWQEIVRIERARPLLRDKAGPAEARPFESKGCLDGCADGCADPSGCFDGEGVLVGIGVVVLVLALAVALWLLVFILIPLVLVPVMEVFLPVGDRVTLVMRDGGSLVLRDLCDADEFLREVGDRVPVVS